MRRYLLAALAIAAISIVATSLLYEMGALSRCADKLADFYAQLGFLPPGTVPHRGAHYVAFSLLGLATSWAALDIPKPSHKWIVIIGTMLLVTGFSLSLLSLRIFFEPFSSLFAILVAASLAYAFSLTEEGSRKALLHLYLGDRISQQTFSSLLTREPPRFLQCENTRVTVLCLRLFNLAALRHALPPPDLVDISARFLRHSAEFLAQRGAYLEESSPDSVRALFGLASSNAATPHAEQACQVARELATRLANLNHELEARFFHHLEFGIALASGDVTVGPYRSPYLSRIAAIGDLSEYAHRLCGANAAYGSRILLNAETYALIRESHAVRPMELMFDASKELMAEAYELLERKEHLTPADEAARERFWQGVILYREGRAEDALKIFSELQADRPQDRPLNYFIDRAQSLLLDKPESHGPHSFLVHGHARVLQTV